MSAYWQHRDFVGCFYAHQLIGTTSGQLTPEVINHRINGVQIPLLSLSLYTIWKDRTVLVEVDIVKHLYKLEV